MESRQARGMPDFVLPRVPIASLAFASVLAACGGGGGGESGGGGDGGGGAGGGGGGGGSLAIGGTAATGAALAGATVEAKCAIGTGSTTTLASGRYDLSIPGGVAPCVLRATSGATKLHSIVPAGINAATANLTPLAELVVARAAAVDPETLFANFDAAAQSALTQAAIDRAQADVIAALKPAIELTGLNPIGGDASVGGTLDEALDAFDALLAARAATLADMSATIASGSTDAATRLLAPSASTCDGLRSGNFRLVDVAGGRLDGVTRFDATTLGYVLPDGTPGTLMDQGGCKFTTPSGDATLLFSSRSGFGALVSVPANGKPSFVLLGIPDQTIGVAELAGTWNYVTYMITTAAGTFAPTYGTFSVDAAGKLGNAISCVNTDPCTPADPGPAALTLRASGGFQRTTPAGTDNYYAFKTGADRYTMVAMVSNSAMFGYFVATKQQSRNLPAAGDVQLLRSVNVDLNGVAGAIADNTFTVQSVDTATQSFLRQRQQDGRLETLDVNKPLTGFNYRRPGAAPAIATLALPGSGSSVFVSAEPTRNFFGVSIQHQ